MMNRQFLDKPPNQCHTASMDNIIGKMYSDLDLKILKEIILGMAKDSGTGYALRVLKHGYETTTLTKDQYQDIFKEVSALPFQADRGIGLI
jgi:hypothetical protein